MRVDGTVLNVPETLETRQAFSVQVNQYAWGACVQALAVVVYDMLNDLGIAAGFGKREGERKLLLTPEVWEAAEPGDVPVMDRGFAD